MDQPGNIEAGFTDLMGYNEPGKPSFADSITCGFADSSLDRPENAIDPGTAAAKSVFSIMPLSLIYLTAFIVQLETNRHLTEGC